MKPIGNMIKNALDKASKFIDKIAGHWESGLVKLLVVFESIDIMMDASSGAARFAADITQSVCAKDAAVKLIGTDIFKSIEDAAPTFLSFAREFKKALFSLSDALLSDAWKTIKNTLESIVNESRALFATLSPLEDLGESHTIMCNFCCNC